MSEQVDVSGVSAGQLAQARGCYPENFCHADCVQAARSTLVKVDELYPEEVEALREQVAWIRAQEWL